MEISNDVSQAVDESMAQRFEDNLEAHKSAQQDNNAGEGLNLGTDQVQKERKIDYSNTDPISFKQTSSLLNYFIINTSQFLNTFAQVAEDKLHKVDEKLDDIEAIIMLYEAKLESIPEEVFTDVPQVEVPVAQQEVVARTENPLLVAQSAAPKNQQAKSAPAKSDGKKKGGFVPPPPADGQKIQPPPGMPKVKVYESVGDPPAGIKFPGVEQVQSTPTADGGDGGAAEAEEVNDGLTEEQRTKMKLENDDIFKGYIKFYKMGIPLANIRQRMRNEGHYDPALLNQFCSAEHVAEADQMMV